MLDMQLSSCLVVVVTTVIVIEVGVATVILITRSVNYLNTQDNVLGALHETSKILIILGDTG